MKRILQLYLYEFLLTIVWIAIILIINPLGNFPLNDDWVYSQVVDILLKSGKYVPGEGPITTLIAQVYWGALFCLIFGYSFTILRISTLVIGIFGILYFYRILLKTTLNKNVSLAGALLIMINPLYLSLSYTFMTDVPFVSMCILATLLFYEYLKKERIILLISATVVSVIAVMIRQLGLLLAFAFAITYLLNLIPQTQIQKEKGRIWKIIIKAVFPFLTSLALFFLLSYWIKHSRNMPEYYNTVYGISNITQPFQSFIVDYIFKFILRLENSFMLCAMCFTPLIIMIFPKHISKLLINKNYLSLIITGFAAIIMIPVFYYYYSAASFFKGNMILNLGTGPKLLRDAYIWKMNISPMLSDRSINIIAIIGIMLLIALMILLIDSFIDLTKKLKERMYDVKTKFMFYCFIILILYCGYFSISTKYHDRYLLLFIIFMLMILIISYHDLIIYTNKIKLIIAYSVFILISYFSISSTHDYLSWNRARWNAINYLIKDKKVAHELIDGGYEYNGLYNPNGVERYLQNEKYTKNDKEEYIISFGKMYNYSSIKSFEYPYLLNGTNNKIEVLKKNNKQ